MKETFHADHDQWLYHAEEGARLFKAGEPILTEDDGWYDHPDKCPGAQPKEPEPPADDHLDRLRRTAEQLGIKVDKRWGAARLESEIENAD